VEAARGGRALGALVADLAAARIGDTFNQYCRSQLRRERLERYLEEHGGASVVLVGEAAGYRGARISGIPFTSERQLAGTGPAEATATIVHRVLEELGLEEDVLLWNVVPTHPHEPGYPQTNRRPSRAEVEASSRFLERVTRGRLATHIADTLRGKGKPEYTPHVDTGDFVVVVNAEKIHVTGNKLDQKMYHRHSGYPGGLRSRTLRDQLERRPTEVIRKAVKGMLPRNKLANAQINKLKVYAGPEHPHAAQNPEPLKTQTGSENP